MTELWYYNVATDQREPVTQDLVDMWMIQFQRLGGRLHAVREFVNQSLAPGEPEWEIRKKEPLK